MPHADVWAWAARRGLIAGELGPGLSRHFSHAMSDLAPMPEWLRDLAHDRALEWRFDEYGCLIDLLLDYIRELHSDLHDARSMMRDLAPGSGPGRPRRRNRHA
jgi:hypothetical protein